MSRPPAQTCCRGEAPVMVARRKSHPDQAAAGSVFSGRCRLSEKKDGQPPNNSPPNSHLLAI